MENRIENGTKVVMKHTKMNGVVNTPYYYDGFKPLGYIVDTEAETKVMCLAEDFEVIGK